MHMIQVVFLTVMVFFVIVTIHEWGHYYFAKRAGILVREFAIGFGPKLFSIKRGETRYTLRLVPAGGFVRMAGEDPELVEIQTGQTIAVRVKDNQVTRIYLDRLDDRSNVVRGEVEYLDLERKIKHYSCCRRCNGNLFRASAGCHDWQRQRNTNRSD